MEYLEKTLQIPKETGYSVRTNWIEEHKILIEICGDNSVRILANKEGLETLAVHLLTLAQDGIGKGMHVHYDVYGGLEEGSCDVIIERG
ncbi:Imm32 family immunity protein [Halodesulfovibrio spirochaetisodalis]|uniref:Uncharacterized protein n=1 Tax=Halodesulfovibrio spirochaetisodalis TaxID=1560234 RepID=A0A1B7XAL8_9BACT|nr:hypothetical protein [Halodesulfovibrio spirochaetisodalis]OBQ46405.1 hypothetical protein SP90_12820 [Halodesulfovibrio spirochaetisodalis]